jgi:hypothetical protein
MSKFKTYLCYVTEKRVPTPLEKSMVHIRQAFFIPKNINGA